MIFEQLVKLLLDMFKSFIDHDEIAGEFIAIDRDTE